MEKIYQTKYYPIQIRCGSRQFPRHCNVNFIFFYKTETKLKDGPGDIDIIYSDKKCEIN